MHSEYNSKMGKEQGRQGGCLQGGRTTRSIWKVKDVGTQDGQEGKLACKNAGKKRKKRVMGTLWLREGVDYDV